MEKTKGTKTAAAAQGEKAAEAPKMSSAHPEGRLGQPPGPNLALLPHPGTGTHQLPGASGADSWASSGLPSPPALIGQFPRAGGGPRPPLFAPETAGLPEGFGATRVLPPLLPHHLESCPSGTACSITINTSAATCLSFAY